MEDWILYIIIACAVLLVAAVVLIVCCCCCRKRCCTGAKRNVNKSAAYKRTYGNSSTVIDIDDVDAAPRVDLHGYRAREAENVMINFLNNQYYEYKRNGGGRYVNVITGKGNHSENNIPVIKPQTEKYLRKQYGRYSWASHGGMVTVDLSSKR